MRQQEAKIDKKLEQGHVDMQLSLFLTTNSAVVVLGITLMVIVTQTYYIEKSVICSEKVSQRNHFKNPNIYWKKCNLVKK